MEMSHYLSPVDGSEYPRWWTLLCVFGGSAISFELEGKGLGAFMNENGMKAVVFEFFRHFPLTYLIIIVFSIGIFISAVTMCNSATTTVAALSVSSKENGAEVEPPKTIKIFWGLVMALVAIVNLLSGQAGEITGIDATKQITTLTGSPVGHSIC